MKTPMLTLSEQDIVRLCHEGYKSTREELLLAIISRITAEPTLTPAPAFRNDVLEEAAAECDRLVEMNEESTALYAADCIRELKTPATIGDVFDAALRRSSTIQEGPKPEAAPQAEVKI